jgi:class 3 adenylate cyclase/tetratricopeptide (TPR) repeat protein
LSFVAKLQRAREVLEQQGRLSVRALGRELDVTGDELEELVEELVEIQRVARQEGRALVWSDRAARVPVPAPAPHPTAPAAERSPRDYTPKHLADRILQSKSALEGERKQVSVLFADVKQSLELAERVDAEAWHAILERFFEILTDGVHRFEGTVNQYTGDGIMALFGAPIAHEDHAQRACYAALHLRNALKAYADELRLSRGLDFAARIGINSGEVVVGKIGDDLRMDYTAQGLTVGLAQRMEQLAGAGAACVSEPTAKLVQGYVRLGDLGTAAVKGVKEPVQVYELEGMGELQTRFDVSRSRGLTRFVGRDDDMTLLEQALEQANAGNGQVVGVVAEAGTGKSRLCFEFVERCRARGINVYTGSGVAHGRNIPLLPIMQVFRAYFGINESDGDRAAREKIAGRLLLLDEGFREFLPLVFDLMGVSDPARPAPAMDPDARQRRLFAVQRRVVAGTRDEVNVTLIEDLHWIDDASEAWLANMVEAAAGAKSLLVVNFRPEYRATWVQKSYYRQLPLLPLGKDAVRDLLTDLLGSDPSLAGLAETIHERTAGNPFFTEEVVQALIESGNLEGARGAYRLTTPIDHLEVPSTVQAVLSARIDRLPESEKQLLQTASVIGKEFAEPILEAVAEPPTGDLAGLLQALKDSEFIYQQALYPVSEYAFKHPLTQEVALGSQLQDRRRRVHAAVACAIQEAHPDKLDERAALLAHHYESAGEMLEAVRWHRRAAEWLLRSDMARALAHWLRVYEIASGLPAVREAMELAVKACEMLLSNGWRVSLLDEPAWERLAREGEALADRLEDPRALFGVHLGLATIRSLSGVLHTATEPARRAVELADALGEPKARCAARNIMIEVLRHGGELDEAVELTRELLAIGADDLSIGVERYAVSLLAWCQGRLGLLEAWRGRPAQGVPLIERCLEIVRAREQFEPMAWCMACLVEIGSLTGVVDQVMVHAQRALDFADRSGSPFTQNAALLCLGEAHLALGEPDKAVAPLEQAGMAAREQNMNRHVYAQILALLADARRGAGDAVAARETAEAGIGFAQQSRTTLWEVPNQLALARALRALDAGANRTRIVAALDRAEALATEGSIRAALPEVAEERGRLTEALGHDVEAERLLRAAQQLYTEVGAEGHVRRLAAELGG